MNFITSKVQGQAAPQNITTNQSFLVWSLHSRELNWYQNKRYGDSKGDFLQRDPYSKRALLEESMINVAIVFKVLQSCDAGMACRKVVTRFFIKRTVFLSRSLCCGSQKQQLVRDAQMSLHNCNTSGIKLQQTPINFHIVTLRHNISTSCGSMGCMGVGLIYRSKQMMEINRYSTPVQIMHELTYFKNVYIINFKKV